MEIDQYLLNADVIDQEAQHRIAEQAAEGKTTFFAAAREYVVDDTLLVQTVSNFFEHRFIEHGYGIDFDVDATNKVGDVFRLTEKRSFVAGDGQHIFCLIYDPTDERLQQQFINKLGDQIQFAMCSAKTYSAIYDLSVRPALLSIRANHIQEDNGTHAKIQASSSEAQELLDELLKAGISRRASDIHIMPLGQYESLVRLRVDGVLQDYTQISSRALPMLKNLLVARANIGGDTATKPVEGQFYYQYQNNKSVDTRINIVNAKLGPDFNLRFIRGELKHLDDIGLNETNKVLYQKLLRLTKGMVIVTGPTGSGKSTLLYAGCREIAGKELSIFAIEDPVEIVMPQITQINIQPEKHYQYADALKSALRHDPDVILIGEIRDKTVAEEAIRASNTGHLVFTTLHTNDALGGLSRLINIGIDPYSLGDCLAAIVAQRLVRRVCSHCKEPYSLPADHRWREQYELGGGEIILTRGQGCEVCAGTGYYGRIAINEILTVTPQLSRAIQHRASKTDLQAVLKEEKFVSFIEDGKQKALEGITSFDELDPFLNDIL